MRSPPRAGVNALLGSNTADHLREIVPFVVGRETETGHRQIVIAGIAAVIGGVAILLILMLPILFGKSTDATKPQPFARSADAPRSQSKQDLGAAGTPWRRIQFLPIALSRRCSRRRSRLYSFHVSRVQKKPTQAATQKSSDANLFLILRSSPPASPSVPYPRFADTCGREPQFD